MGSLPPDKAGVGSAINDTTREFGGTLGVAIIGSVFASLYTRGIANAAALSGLPDDLRSAMGAPLPSRTRSSLNSRPHKPQVCETSQRLAGHPVNCRFYLIGNPVVVNGLFQKGAMAGLGAPVRVCISQTDGQDVWIAVDEPTAFFSQFPELGKSDVPAVLDKELIDHLIAFAS